MNFLFVKNFESEKFDEVKPSASVGIMAWERENFKLIYVCVEKKSKILEYGQFDVQVIGKIL